MPELGTLGRRQAASLFGLAPFDRDSGQHRGSLSIRGGRALPPPAVHGSPVRDSLQKPASQARYERLRAQGKQHKVAMVAVMRKLVSLLTALLRDDRLRQPQLPAQETVS